MQSLSSFIKSRTAPFSVAGTFSKKLLIFDVDDTLIHTTANIWVMKKGKHIKTLSNSEYNDYVLGPGEEFDYREFEDPKILFKEAFTRYWDTLKREYQRGTHISILTARGNGDMIRKFFLSKGIDIKPALVFAVGDPRLSLTGSIQQRKAEVIAHITKLGYNTLVFFDDNEGNLKAAKDMEKKLNNIKIHTVKA